MSQVLHIILYKAKNMLKDRLLLALFLILPLLFTLIIGGVQSFAQGGAIPIVLVDLDQSEYSNLVLQRLMNKEGFKFLTAENEELARKQVKNYQAEVGFIINKGFQDAVIKEQEEGTITLIKSPNSLSYVLIREMMAGEVIRLTANASSANWVTKVFTEEQLQIPAKGSNLWLAAWDYADSLWEPKPLLTVEYRELGAPAETAIPIPTVSVINSLTLGMLVFFIMLLVLYNTGWLLEERHNHTFQRLIQIEGMLGRYFLANWFILVLVAVAEVLYISLTAWFIYRVELLVHPEQVIVLSLYILAAASLSMFFSTLFQTQTQLYSIVPVFSLLTGFLGGCFWSFLPLPDHVRFVSYLTPQGWAMLVLQESAINGYTGFLPLILLIIMAVGLAGGAYFRLLTIAQKM